MGKAARRQKDRRKKRLIALSYQSADRFEDAWNKRLVDWLYEIRRLSKQWAAGGPEGNQTIFKIVTDALQILQQCSPVVRRRCLRITEEELSHACTAQVARIVDKRFCRLNLLDPEELKAKSRGPRI